MRRTSEEFGASLSRDLRIAIRYLAKSPGFVVTAVAMLALGIGATTAIFSIVEGVLLRPLPFPQPDRVVVLSDTLQGFNIGGNNEVGVTIPDIRNYLRDTRSFSSLGGYRHTEYELSGVGEPAMLHVTRMTAGVFPALGVTPLMGRYFTAQEDEKHEQVVVLSYATWQDRFHGDEAILGEKILLDRNPYLVIGVMPPEFEFPLVPGHLDRTELWVPFSFTAEELATSSASNWSYQMVGRLKPGVSEAQARNDAGRVASETMKNYPAFMAAFVIRAVVRPLHEETVEQARPLVRTLFLAVFVVLLIACANLAGLLLVRAIRRQREVAVRLALGARAGTLLRQAVLESLVLSVAGGVVGLALAAAALKFGLSRLPETLPLVSSIGLDWQVVAFALGLAILTGVVCGLAPAFAAIRTSVNDTLKEGGRTGTSGGGHALLRSGLVVLEIAIALVLLTASGLLLRSFQKMRDVDIGFRPDHTLVAAYALPEKQYATQSQIDEFNHELLRRLQALPGVVSLGITSLLPESGSNSNSAFTVEGYGPPKGEAIDLGTPMRVQGDYFAAMGIPLLRGRLLTVDDKEGGQLVMVVNHKLAEQFWPGQDAVGKRIRLGTRSMETPWATVVGVVADVKEGSPDKETKQQFYVAAAQTRQLAGKLIAPTDLTGDSGYIVLRTAVAPEQIENLVRATVHDLDPQLALTEVQTMEHAISENEAPRRFNTTLITAFAGTALLLAVLGIYSVIAFSVALRTHEIAIRMALGSQRTGIVRLVLISGAKLALIGCAIGLIGSMLVSRLMRSFLFEVSALDPVVLALSGLLVLLLALVACLLPARRAASVDPMQALRAD